MIRQRHERSARPRYLGDVRSLEMHDLYYEEPECEIENLIALGHDRAFSTLESARVAGFDRVHVCVGYQRL